MASDDDHESRFFVMVENLSDDVNNAKLREVFNPLRAKRCKVAYIERKHMGTLLVKRVSASYRL